MATLLFFALACLLIYAVMFKLTTPALVVSARGRRIAHGTKRFRWTEYRVECAHPSISVPIVGIVCCFFLVWLLYGWEGADKILLGGGIMIPINLRSLFQRLGKVIAETSKKRDEENKKEQTLKWARGKRGSMVFCTKTMKGEWEFINPTEEEMENITGGYVKGLLANLFDMQVLIDEAYVKTSLSILRDGGVGELYRGRYVDPLAVNAHVKATKRRFVKEVFEPLQDVLGVWILPLVKGKKIPFNGVNYVRMIAIKKRDGGFVEDLRTRFKEAYGFKLNMLSIREIAKTLLYLATSICETDPMDLKVVVIPKRACVNPDVYDGAMTYITHEDPETLLTTRYEDRHHHVKLDGRVLHVRGFSVDSGRDKNGIIAKATIQPFTIRNLKDEHTDEWKEKVIEYAKKGYLIATSDTLKYAKDGEYVCRLWLHDDSAMHTMFGRGKLFFEQLARKMRFKSFDGIKDLIKARVYEIGQAFESTSAMAKYLLKYKDVYNTESLPVKEFTDYFEQVGKGGMPPGLNISFIGALFKSIPLIMKGMCEVMIGCRTYAKHGKILFNWTRDKGIYLQGFIRMRTNLKDHEISLPCRAFDLIEAILKHTGKTWGDLLCVIRRCPILVASFQKVKIIRRTDNHAYIGLSSHVMMNLGGDSDGDKGSITITLKDMFDYQCLDNRVFRDWDTKFEPKFMKMINDKAELFSPMRSVKNDENIEKALGQVTWELLDNDNSTGSGGIGTIDSGIFRLALYLARKKWSKAMIWDFMFKMEVGWLDENAQVVRAGYEQLAIEGKKVLATEVPNLLMFNRLINEKDHHKQMIYDFLPRIINILRAKVEWTDNAKLADLNPTSTVFCESIAEVPQLIRRYAYLGLYGNWTHIQDESAKEVARNNHAEVIRSIFPFHAAYFEAIIEMFPREMKEAGLNYAWFTRGKDCPKNKCKELSTYIMRMYNGMDIPIDKGGHGFMILDQYDQDTHEHLEEYSQECEVIRDNTELSDQDKNRAINRMKKPTFDKIASRPKSDEGRAAIEFALLSCACQNGNARGSKYSFIFNYVNPLILRAFFDLVTHDTDPNDTLDYKPEETKEEEEKFNEMDSIADFSIVTTDKPEAYVYGNLGVLPQGYKDEIFANFNVKGQVSLKDIPTKDYIIAVVTDKKDDPYEQMKDKKGAIFYYRATKNTWRYRELGS